MRNLYYLVATILCFAACKQAAKPVKTANDTILTTQKDHAVKANNIFVLHYRDIEVSTIKLGEKSSLLNKIGRADSVVIVKSDFDVPDIKRYYLKKSYFEIDTNRTIYGFDINDQPFILKPFNIKIGDNMRKVLEKINPYIDSKNDRNNLKDNMARIRIDDSDDYIELDFKNGVLNEYCIWNNL